MVDDIDENQNHNDSINHRDTVDSKAIDKAENKLLTYSDDGKDHLRVGAMEKDERTQTLVGFTGERDYEIAPKSENILHWHAFCTDMYSSDRKVKEVEDICNSFSHRYIDLRPYMME